MDFDTREIFGITNFSTLEAVRKYQFVNISTREIFLKNEKHILQYLFL